MWEEVAIFILVGFCAQLVDGSIGMAYGLTGTTVLLSTGLPPATASASVHAAEVFTTAMSGAWHWQFGNVRWKILITLAIPGMIGGAAGAYLLTRVPGDVIQPLVSGYLGLMGAYIIWRAVKRREARSHPPRWLPALGLGGGFLDAIGGGGWGPLVTSAMLGYGNAARQVIGSVNAAEFFVTLVISFTFLGTIGLELWPIITGLIIGGALGAPVGAYVARHMPDKPLMLLVGAGIILLSLRGIFF